MVWESSALRSAGGSFSLLPVLSVGGRRAEPWRGSASLDHGTPGWTGEPCSALAGGDTREVLVALALQSGFENTTAGTVNAQPSGSLQAVSVC